MEFTKNTMIGGISYYADDEEKRKEQTVGLVRIIQIIAIVVFTMWYVKKYDFKKPVWLILGLVAIWIGGNILIKAIKEKKEEKPEEKSKDEKPKQ